MITKQYHVSYLWAKKKVISLSLQEDSQKAYPGAFY